MLVIRIIFCNFAVLVVGKSQFVILCTVDNALLDSRIYLAKSHWRRCRSKCLYHLYAGRTLLYADLFAL